ncbi:putative amino acid binding protein [Tripterygium wilfordii]|uniref:ACT domain-containing protein ACR n=1 Tax=Tripterygium wilfordii TaxID=458696 RepID=A0A7J7DU50_TRIWF|nr:ACT domain-containing protein ACR1 [Tripterygium wilfordii]XP_038692601.1 ACT domain-containing protein ACR1 [Tripterygium wilfordii]XP_038692609.1 ACT domain-containing protein ACR1 [Tripterygium wilfordii]KAF5749684.1 putative amino acid binding protein [Tripterygium wilfordii]
MEIVYQPYIDPEYESLIERIHPPRVCIDNDACQDCTLVKVDSANKHGILLDMVQVLTDLDLVISKAYISSDGGWFMDVFHVTDQLGNKLTDPTLILYIQQALCASRGGGVPEEAIQRGLNREYVSADYTALEMTGIDRPGLVSEISAVLVELGCNIAAAVAWTHNTHWACVIYIEDGQIGGPIVDHDRLAHIQEQLANVVEAHHGKGERSSVRLTAPVSGRTHTERRLHQLMYSSRDYESCHGCNGGAGHWAGCTKTHVSIEPFKEKGYSVVNVKSRDRPKLLFDTVCALTDLQYVVFHAAVSSKGTTARQEYFIRQKDGCTLDTESQRRKLTKCLIAAIERRVPHGLRMDICTKNRMGQLSDITRVLRENGLSISRVEMGTNGERATGAFYVTDTSGHEVDTKTVELVRQEVGGSILLVHRSSGWSSHPSSSSISRTSSGEVDDRPRFSLRNLLGSQLERLSSNFGPIRP